MAATAVSSRLVKMIAPTLSEYGFTRYGKIFLRPEGNLTGLIQFSIQPKAWPDVTLFRVDWGIILPGLVAYLDPNGPKGPKDLHLGYAAPGDALVPPAAHYAGLFPRQRQVDATWGVPEGSREGAQECADAIIKGLKKDVLPTIISLSKPGAFLEEIYSNKDNHRLHFANWWFEAIHILIDDGPIEQIRELLSHEDDPQGEFYTWVEHRLQEREKAGKG